MQFLIEPPDHPYAREVHCSEAEIAEFPTYASCPCCGKAEAQVKLAALGQQNWSVCMDLVQCRACSHVFYANPPDEKWFENFYRSEWNSKRGETVSVEIIPGTGVKDTAARMLLHARIEDRAATILEIGCGTGDMLAGLQERGFSNLYGTEASDYRAAKTELRFPGRAFRGGYSAVPPGLEFDFIFSHHVMEHVYNPHQAMQWMTDRLRPGGLIAVTVPNSLIEPVLNQLLFVPHLHSFSPHSLMSMGESLGLGCVFWRGANTPYEITALFYRKREARPFNIIHWIDDGISGLTGPVPMTERFRALNRIGRPGETVHFLLHAGEKGAAAMQSSSGIKQVGAATAWLAGLTTVLGRHVATLGFRRAGNKWIGRLRVLTAHLKTGNQEFPVVGSISGDVVFHIK